MIKNDKYPVHSISRVNTYLYLTNTLSVSLLVSFNKNLIIQWSWTVHICVFHVQSQSTFAIKHKLTFITKLAVFSRIL